MTALLDTPAVERSRSLAHPDFTRGVAVGAAALAIAWPLGLVYLGWVVLGGLALLGCLRRRFSTLPAATAPWLVLLVLILLSAAQVETWGRAAAFGYRFSIYVAITAVCAYVYNDRRRFSQHRVMGMLGGVYLVVVLSGVAGLLFPDFLERSLLLQVLPSMPPDAGFVNDTLTMQLAEQQDILRDGASHIRPKGVFAYTNDWASVYAVVTVALLSYLQQQRRLSARWLGLAGLGVWPLVASLSRAAWASLLLGLIVIVVVRLVRAGVRQVLPVLLVVGLAGTVILLGPAGDTVERRLETAHSDNGRQARVDEAVARVAERPLTGYGTPLPSRVHGGPSVGTHGQFWLVFFSQGYPGAIAFALFCAGLIAFAVRAGPHAEPLLAAVVVLAAQSFFYEWMALQVAVVLCLAATQPREPSPPLRPQPDHPVKNEVSP